MPVQKVTLSIDSEIYKNFQSVKQAKGISISSWVTSLMAKEVEDYRQDMIVKLHSGIDIAKAMYSAGIRLSIIKEKLQPIYGEVQTQRIMQEIS